MQSMIAALRRAGQAAGVGLISLIAFQLLCATIFIADAVAEANRDGGKDILSMAFLPEASATVGLCVGIGFEVQLLWRMRRRQDAMAKGLSIAAGALDELMQKYFRDWDLTPAESDVASFTIKGFSITEVAELRGSAEGTVKTHLNAIYRKAGVTGRAQLVSLLVEDLFQAPLVRKAA